MLDIMEDRLALVLAELIKNLLRDEEYPEESSIIARAAQLGISFDELEIIGPLVIKDESEGQTYCCEEVNGNRVFSKLEHLIIGRDKINYLAYLYNKGIISGAELDAILVFAQSLARNKNEQNYLLKAINLVLEDKNRADFLAGALQPAKELPN